MPRKEEKFESNRKVDESGQSQKKKRLRHNLEESLEMTNDGDDNYC